ncbi:hypothetical protein HDZ31DRAFT_77728, partial [Schizophyllum fasciatum]
SALIGAPCGIENRANQDILAANAAGHAGACATSPPFKCTARSIRAIKSAGRRREFEAIERRLCRNLARWARHKPRRPAQFIPSFEPTEGRAGASNAGASSKLLSGAAGCLDSPARLQRGIRGWKREGRVRHKPRRSARPNPVCEAQFVRIPLLRAGRTILEHFAFSLMSTEFFLDVFLRKLHGFLDARRRSCASATGLVGENYSGGVLDEVQAFPPLAPSESLQEAPPHQNSVCGVLTSARGAARSSVAGFLRLAPRASRSAPAALHLDRLRAQYCAHIGPNMRQARSLRRILAGHSTGASQHDLGASKDLRDLYHREVVFGPLRIV